MIATDLDGDGTIDLVRPEMGGEITVDRGRCLAQGWLEVRLHQDGANAAAIGAQVVAIAGRDRWWRMVSAGSTGFASRGPPDLHFGLGPHDAVDRLEVTWPDGETLAIDGPIPARRKLDVTRAP